MTYEEMLSVSYFQALRGLDANVAPNLDDATTIMEALVPSVFQAVAEGYAGTGERRKQSLLRRTHSLTVTNGVAVLPETVLTSCMVNSSIDDPDDVTVAQAQSFCGEWFDYVQPRDAWQIQLNIYCVKGDLDFHYLPANEEYDPSSGFSGTIELTVPSVPEIPASASDALDVSSEVTSDIVEALAEALRGAITSRATQAAA